MHRSYSISFLYGLKWLANNIRFKIPWECSSAGKVTLLKYTSSSLNSEGDRLESYANLSRWASSEMPSHMWFLGFRVRSVVAASNQSFCWNIRFNIILTVRSMWLPGHKQEISNGVDQWSPAHQSRGQDRSLWRRFLSFSQFLRRINNLYSVIMGFILYRHMFA